MKSWGLSSGKVLSLPVFQSCVVLLYPLPEGLQGVYLFFPGWTQVWCGCACLGAIVFLHCKGVVWEFASQPHVKSTRTMPDRPKNERDIVKPTVNICAAVIFFVWACPQRVPPFSCLECGARIGGLQALRHWGLPRRKGPRCLQVMPAGHDHIRLWTLGLFAYRTQGLHTEGS